MASVRKRKWTHEGVENEAWIVSYTDQSGKRRIKTFDKKKDADRHRTQVEVEISQEKHTPERATLTVADTARLWFESLEKRHLATSVPSTSTIRNYRAAVGRHIIPKLGALLLTKLDPDMIQEWLTDLRSSKAFGGVERVRTTLMQMVKFAIRKRYLNRNVLQEHAVRTPGSQNQIIVPSIEDVRSLLEVSGHRFPHEQELTVLRRGVFVRIALFTGMRAGEIAGLHWDNIDWARGAINVTWSYSNVNGLKSPKTRAGVRVVPMVGPLREALEALHAFLHRPKGGAVFLSRTGTLFGGSMLHLTYWQPSLRRAGLLDANGKAPYHLHSLRHVAVSMLLASGMDVLSISRLVGHKWASTTLNVYGHLMPHDDRLQTSMGDVATLMLPTTARQGPLTI